MDCDDVRWAFCLFVFLFFCILCSWKAGDLEQFRVQLDGLGLKIVQVTADGNCFFRFVVWSIIFYIELLQTTMLCNSSYVMAEIGETVVDYVYPFLFFTKSHGTVSFLSMFLPFMPFFLFFLAASLIILCVSFLQLWLTGR